MDETLPDKFPDDVKPTFLELPQPPLPVLTPGSSGAPGRIIRKVVVVDPNKIKKLGLEQKIIHAMRKLGDSKHKRSSVKQRNLQYLKPTTIITGCVKTIIQDNRLGLEATKATSKLQILSVEQAASEIIPISCKSTEVEYEKYRKSIRSKQLLESFPFKKREIIAKTLRFNDNNEVIQSSDNGSQTKDNGGSLKLKATNSVTVDQKLTVQTNKNFKIGTEQEQEFCGFTSQEINSECSTLRRLSILIEKSDSVAPNKIPSFSNLKTYLTHRKYITPEIEDNNSQKLNTNITNQNIKSVVTKSKNDPDFPIKSNSLPSNERSSRNPNHIARKPAVSSMPSEALSSTVERRQQLPVTLLKLGKTIASSNLIYKVIEEAKDNKKIAESKAGHHNTIKNSIIESLEEPSIVPNINVHFIETQTVQPIPTSPIINTKPWDKGIIVLDQKVYKPGINIQSLSNKTNESNSKDDKKEFSEDTVDRTILLKVISRDPITNEIQIQVVDPLLNIEPQKKVETDPITNICKLYAKKMMRTGIKHIQINSSDSMVLPSTESKNYVDQTNKSIMLNSNTFTVDDVKLETEMQSTSQVFSDQCDAVTNIPNSSSIKQEAVMFVDPVEQFNISSVKEKMGSTNNHFSSNRISENSETYIQHDTSWPAEITGKDGAGHVQEMDAVEYILSCSKNKLTDDNLSSFEDEDNLYDSDWNDEVEFDGESNCDSEYQPSDMTGIYQDSNIVRNQNITGLQNYNNNPSHSQIEPNSIYEFEVNSEVITLIEQAEITFESDMKPPQLLSVIDLNNFKLASSKQLNNEQSISGNKIPPNTEIKTETIAVASSHQLMKAIVSEGEEELVVVPKNVQIPAPKRTLLDYLVALKSDSIDETNQQVEQGIARESYNAAKLDVQLQESTSAITYKQKIGRDISPVHRPGGSRFIASPITSSRNSDKMYTNVNVSNMENVDKEIQRDFHKTKLSIAGNKEESILNSTTESLLNSRSREESIGNRANISRGEENVNDLFLDHVYSLQKTTADLASDNEQNTSSIRLSTENCLQVDTKICNESSVNSEDMYNNSPQTIYSIDIKVLNKSKSEMAGTNVAAEGVIRPHGEILECSQKEDSNRLKKTIAKPVITKACSDKEETKSFPINKNVCNKQERLGKVANKNNQKYGECEAKRKSIRLRKPNIRNDFVMLVKYSRKENIEDNSKNDVKHVSEKNANNQDETNITEPKFSKSRRKNTIPEIDKLALETRSKRKMSAESDEEIKQLKQRRKNINKSVSTTEQMFLKNNSDKPIDKRSKQLLQNEESTNCTSFTETTRKSDRPRSREEINHEPHNLYFRKRRDANLNTTPITTVKQMLNNKHDENNTKPLIETRPVKFLENKKAINNTIKDTKRRAGKLRSDEEIKPQSLRRRQRDVNLNKSIPPIDNKHVEISTVLFVDTLQENEERNDTLIAITKRSKSQNKQGDDNLNNSNQAIEQMLDNKQIEKNTDPAIGKETEDLQQNKESTNDTSVTEAKRKPGRPRKIRIEETATHDLNSPLKSKERSKCVRRISSETEEDEPIFKKIKTQSYSKNTTFARKKVIRKLPASDCYIHPKLLLVETRDDLDKDFEITIENEKIGGRTIKIEKADNQLSQDLIQCGTCKQLINEKIFAEHLKTHFGVGWREGKDDPINMSSYREVLNAMVYFMKKNKISSFKCKFCDEEKKSAIGILGHIQICMVPKEQLNDLMDTCEVCGKRFMPYNMWGHTKSCKPALPEVENILEIQANSDGRVKRQSLLKAQSSFKEMMSSEYKLSVDDFIKPYTLPRGGIYIKWRSEIGKNGKAKCYEAACSYESRETSELKAHIKICSHIRRGGYSCTRCKFYNIDQEVVRKHVRKKHQSEINTLMYNEPQKDFEASESECDLLSENSEDDAESCGPEEEADVLSLDDNINQNVPSRMNLSCNRRLQLKIRDFVNSTESIRKQIHVEEMLFPDAVIQDVAFLEKPFDSYKPANHDSIQFYFNSNSILINKSIGCSEIPKEWFKMGSFNSNIVEEEGIIFIGGPITTFAWAPMPSLGKTNDTEYLAVSYKFNYDTHIKLMQPIQQTSLILIYKCDLIKTKKTKLRSKPTLLYGIPCFGPVHHLVFLPSGGYAPESNRLGLLAVASVQSNIDIYALPLKAPANCDTISNKFCNLLDIKPSLVLCVDLGEHLNSSRDYMAQCTQIVWSEIKSHNFIGAGFSNGFAGIWDIRDEDNLTKFYRNGIKYFVPLTYFRAIPDAISGLDFHYTEDEPRWLVVTNNIRDMRAYDLEDMSSPLLLSQEQGQRSAMSDVLWPIYSENPLMSLGDDYVEDSCSALTKSLLNITYKIKHKMHTPTGINALTFSPCHNALIGACDNGDIVLQKFKTVSTENMDTHLFNKRYVYYTDIIRLDGEQIPKVKQKNVKGSLDCIALATLDCFESDYKEKYGLVFGGPILCDRKTKTDVQSIDRVSPFSIRALTQIKCIQICPNMSNTNLLAIGYNNGLIRIKLIDFSEFV